MWSVIWLVTLFRFPETASIICKIFFSLSNSSLRTFSLTTLTPSFLKILKNFSANFYTYCSTIEFSLIDMVAKEGVRSEAEICLL